MATNNYFVVKNGLAVGNTTYTKNVINNAGQFIGDPTGVIQNSYDTANAAVDSAQSAYNQANAATNSASAAYLNSNAAFIKANAAFDKANTNADDIVLIQGVNNWQNTYIDAVESYSQSAYGKANAATNSAQAAYFQANAAFIKTNAAFDLANTNASDISLIQGVDTWQNTYIVAVESYSQSGYGKANSAAILAQAAFDSANTVFSSSYAHANAAYNQANSATESASFAYARANSAYIQANAATESAQAAYNTANGKLSLTGGTITGDLNVTGHANVYQNIAVGTGSYTILPNTIAQFTGNTEVYSQVNQQNINGRGTADFVVTANNGTDTINYLDLGIAGNQYINTNYNSWSFVNPNDGYVILQGNAGQTYGGNLFIGAIGSGEIANNTAIGDIVFIQGTDSTEIARFALGQGLVLKQGTASSSNTTGTLVVQGGVGISGDVYAGNVYDNGIHIKTYVDTANTFLQANDYATLTAAKSYTDTANNYLQNEIVVIQGVNLTQNNNTTAVNNFAQGAYNQANATNSYATSGYAQANAATNSAQSAYNKANTNASDISVIQGVNVTQNTNITATDNLARGAFGQANAATESAQAAYNQANTNASNITVIQGVDLTQNTNITAADDLARGAFTQANATNNYATSGYAQANAATNSAQAAYNQANATNTYATSGYAQANAATNSASSAYLNSNAAFTQANAAFTQANATNNYATSGYTQANAATNSAQAAYNQANTNASQITAIQGVNLTQNTNITAVNNFAQSAYNQANAATNSAQAAYNTANTKFASAGGTITGQVDITDTTGSLSYSNGALVVAGGVGIGQNLNVFGDTVLNGALTVKGTTTYQSTTTTTYTNPIIQLNTPATGQLTSATSYDIGIDYEHYNPNDLNPRVVTSGSANGTYASLNLSDSTYYPPGSVITVSGVTPSNFNGSWTVTNATPGTITYPLSYTGSVTTSGALGTTIRLTQFTQANVARTGSTANVSYDNSYNAIVLPVNSTVTIEGFVNSQYNGVKTIASSGPGYFTFTGVTGNPPNETLVGIVNFSQRHAFAGRAADTGHFEFYEVGAFTSANVFEGIYGTVRAGQFLVSPIQAAKASDLTEGMFTIQTQTVIDTTTSSGGTVNNAVGASFNPMVYSAANTSITYNNPYTVYIGGAPTSSNNVTISGNAWSLYVASGNSYFNGSIVLNDGGVISFADGTKQSTNAASYNYSIASYAQANAATNSASAAYLNSNSAFIQANAAFNKANSHDAYIAASYAQANATNTYATSGYGQANAATNSASAAYLQANSAFIQANAAFTQANATNNYATSAYAQANATNTYASSAYGQANAATNSASSAYLNSNAAFIQANAAFTQANATNTYATSGYAQANAATNSASAAYLQANSAFIQANAAFTQANATNSYATSGYAQANAATNSASAAYLQANSAFIKANAAFDQANATNTYATSAYGQANATNSYATSGYAQANAATNSASAAYLQANSAFIQANAAFNKANSHDAYIAASYAQANAATNSASSAYNKANGAVQIGWTTITANGTSIVPGSNADTLLITAATANGINILGTNNPGGSDTIDFGLRNSGVTSGTYGGSTNIPVLTVDSFGRITSAANTSVSTTINLSANSGSGSVAGGGTLTITGNSGISTLALDNAIYITNSGITSLFTGSNSRITVSNSTGASTIDLAAIGGLTSGTYSYPQLTVDPYGRITTINSQTPVTSFNGLTGAVTLSSANVVTALGYTPASNENVSANVTYLQGVNTTQNTNITAVNTYATSGYGQANAATNSAQAAYNKANSAAQLSFTTISANGTSIIPDSNTSTLTITATTANGINVIGNAATDTIDIGLRNSGVTAGTYGNTTAYPIITVDQFGRVTSVSNNATSTTGLNNTLDTFTGNGVATNYTLSVSPTSKNYITVSIDGVVQHRSTYTLTGTTLSFSAAPPNGSSIEALSTTFTSTVYLGATPVSSLASANSSVLNVSSSTGDVTLTPQASGVTPGSYSGSVTVDSYGRVTAASNTSSRGNITKTSILSYANTASANNLIDTFSVASFRTASYELQILNGSGYQLSRIMVLQNGTDAILTEMAGVSSYSSLLGYFTANVSSSNVNIYFSPYYVGSTILTGERMTINNIGNSSIINLGQNYDLNTDTINNGSLDLQTYNNFNNNAPVDLSFT